ncbi:class I adenylate-forming enzyme family protein [Mycobacterium sp. NPDC051198]
MADIEPPSTFPPLLAQVVADRADHEALVVSGESLTYCQLDARSAQMATALLAIGAGKGSRIGLLAPDGALWLTVFYAALRIGAIVTPISTLTTPSELSHIVRTSDAQILIGARRFLRNDYAEKLIAALPGLGDRRTGVLRVLGAPHLRSIWLDDVAGLSWARSVDDLLARADSTDAPDAALLAAVEQQVVPDDEAFVVYTSGSTATPKAVVHSQWAVARQPPVLAKYFDLTSEHRTMCLLPAFWMGGIMTALQVLSTGGTLVYPARPDIDEVLDTIERCNVTNTVVWHLSAKLRAAAVSRGVNLDNVRVTGAPLRGEDGELIPPELQTDMLGMSETFGPHSAEPINQRLPQAKAGAAGRAVNGIERRVVDLETRVEVPAGEMGELQLRGGALMTGFYKVDRRQTFTPDGFYPTKDLVWIDADGYLHFVGRTGDMIKTNSANVSRLEVEAALNQLPDIEQAFVAGLPDPEHGEIVTAAVVPAAGSEPTETDIKLALRETLSVFKVPRRVVFVSQDSVPRTSTGKVKLFDLGELIASKIEGRPTHENANSPAGIGPSASQTHSNFQESE